MKQVPASSPIAAIAGKVAGARIAVGTGNPGAAPSIRLRGSTNLTVGNNDPLILVDGVITKNSLADIDANGDGVVSKKEVPGDHALFFEFRLVDTDRNGRITDEELANWK